MTPIWAALGTTEEKIPWISFDDSLHSVFIRSLQQSCVSLDIFPFIYG